jgi:tetratricopeptide (TPR) repeat protein
LNPDNFGAYFNLGAVLLDKGDWDGEIALERQRLRLVPDDARAHANLGVALEKKGERRSALEEYHAAYVLDPKNATYKQNYERLQQLNQ